MNYLTQDNLGSPRINTDRDGRVTARHGYMPFGEEIFTSQRTVGLGYTADTVRQKFTGYERDDESGLDFAQARYYNFNHGRFTSVDPLRASAKTDNPQTWNRYSYTLNSPLKFVDPTGLITDDYYTARDGTIQVFETNDSFDRFYIETTETPGKYQLVAQLERNEAGLVEFPASMDFFDRYGTVDAGGTDKKTGETVGQGDHFVQPVVAAALFGLAAVLKDSYGIKMSFGDMSSSNGSDPWEPSMANKTKNNGHHSGHGHFGQRSGLDVDFRYVNKDGVAFQSQTAISDSQFSREKNQIIYDTAKKFGFTVNYQGTNGTLTGVTKASGHNDHGHLGFNRGSANVIVYRAEVLQNGTRLYRRVP